MADAPKNENILIQQGKNICFKVRVLSGNFVIRQGVLELSIKFGEKSGNFEKSQGKVRIF